MSPPISPLHLFRKPTVMNLHLPMRLLPSWRTHLPAHVRRPLPLAAWPLCAALLLLQGLPAQAGEGHDHGNAAPTAAAGPALPRFAAVSETFELVGVLDGRQLTLYLDRAADNTPVTQAQIELEIGSAKLQATPRGDAYAVELADAPPHGVLPITATVTAGNDTDLLAAELNLHDDDAHTHEAEHTPWRRYARWGGLVALGIAAASGLVIWGRRAAARRAGATA